MSRSISNNRTLMGLHLEGNAGFVNFNGDIVALDNYFT